MDKQLKTISSMLASEGMKSTLQRIPGNEIIIKVFPGEDIRFIRF